MNASLVQVIILIIIVFCNICCESLSSSNSNSINRLNPNNNENIALNSIKTNSINEYDQPNIVSKRSLAAGDGVNDDNNNNQTNSNNNNNNNIKTTSDNSISGPNTTRQRIIPTAKNEDDSLWPTIIMIMVGICGCICLERLVSSCRKVYKKRNGTLGFSQLGNTKIPEDEEEIALGITDSESMDDDDDDPSL